MAKRIGAIVSLSLIGILIITTIIMSIIPVSHAIVCNKPDSISIKVNNGSYLNEFDNEDKEYILNYFNNASKESSLVALFKGTINDVAKVVTPSSSIKTISYKTDNIYIRYNYNESQKLMEGNSTYKDASNNEYSYSALVFEISSTEGESTINVYITGATDNSNTYRKYYEVKGQFSDLFKYVSDIYSENNI